MPEILFNDFSGGWMPGDDPISGRKNGLLQMDNVELDSNGALSLQGGCAIVQSGYPSYAHTMFSRLINGGRHDYFLLANGAGYRDTTSLFTGGDTANGAFGTAFNFTLIASGNKRYKDSGTGTPVVLGIAPPTNTPTLTKPTGSFPKKTIASLITNWVDVTGTSTPSGSLLEATCSAGTYVGQTYNGGGPYDLNALVGTGTGNTGYAMDDDYIELLIYSADLMERSLQIDILLEAGNASGDQVSNYYTYTIEDLSLLDVTANYRTVKLRRSQFQRIGTGTQTWTTTYGFRLTYTGGSGAEVVQIGGLAQGVVATPVSIFGGSKTQKGQYQYLQVLVANNGAYLAKSIAGPVSSFIDLDMSQAYITPDATGYDATQTNELWIYRKGGLLDTWYRIKVLTSSTWGTAFYDMLNDIDTLTLNIKLNINLVSIAYSSISEKIYDIIGPVNGRWYYFTESYMYPSEVNNPDLVDPTIAIRTCGSSSELFMWARQVNESTILVGTSVDVYTLKGTFATFPDFSIDAFYRPLHCKYPPLTCDAVAWGGLVYYLASDGWRSIDPSGFNPTLISPNLDRLYRGETLETYAPPHLKVIPRSIRFPLVIAKNKMWCFMTYGLARIEIYDFIRKYWRVSRYDLGDVTAATVAEDGALLAFYADGLCYREIDLPTSKYIDGATKQVVTIKTMVSDGGMPRNRKDSSTLKIRSINSGTLPVSLTPENGTQSLVGNLNLVTKATDQHFDISSIANLAISKTYQLYMQGAMSSLVLNDASILFDPRPEQRTFVRILNTNFGTASRKRVRNWPIVIDTLGQPVTFTPYVDNVLQSATVLTTNNKDTKNTFFVTDVQGVDYGATLYCPNLFEFYNMLDPEIVQVFPIAKRFDQVGPEELFRYGKVIQIELRIFPVGGTSIPFTIYFNDSSNYVGAFTVTANKDGTYFIRLPKGTSGNVIRVELGPTNFDFYRFYTRIQVARQGRDTELEWINL